MINPIRGARGMAVAPHALAAQSALAVLREGGNAVEATGHAGAIVRYPDGVLEGGSDPRSDGAVASY